MKRKGKKSKISLSRTTLYTQKIKFCMQNFFFSKIVCLSTKINLRLKVTKNIGGNFKNTLKNFEIFVAAIEKNASHTFSYMEIVRLAFFLTKSFSFLFSTIH